MNVCAACAERGKTWEGSDPICGFPNGTDFDPANYMCATINKIRHALEPHLFQPGGPLVAHHTQDADQNMVMINVGEVEGLSALTLWVSWYKSRGRTEAMWLLNEYDPPRLPTEAELLRIAEVL